MKYYGSLLLIIFLLIFYSTEYAQEFNSSVAGLIIDKESNSGIAGVNVFISETTWGTTTDNDGFYEIKNLPSGNHEIVVSIIGFEVVSQNFTLKRNEKKSLSFYLIEKAYELETIEVVSERPENWDHNLELFKTYFLGESDFSKNCKILNEEQLSFSLGAYNELFATADKPINIRNNSLGYDIEIILVSFKWDPKEGRVQYSFKPKFIELISDDREQISKWENNRETAYLGSINHFFKCLLDDTFVENGYKIYLVPKLNRNPQFVAHLNDAIENSSQILKHDGISGGDLLTFHDRLNVEYSSNSSTLYVSWMDLNYNEITLDKFGYPEEFMPFQTIGYWSKLGVADWLPKYYNAKAAIK